MNFTKMNGLGNDYILIDVTREKVGNAKETAVRLSDRRRGIGGDGMVLVGKSDIADLSMRIFNADGTESEMCGNALRCVGKYAYERKLVDKTVLSVETGDGVKNLELRLCDGSAECVRVNMGLPKKGHDGDGNFIRYIHAGKDFRVYCVSTGNPHAILFVDEFTDGVMESGREISENTRYFPNRTNVEFVLKNIENDILMVRVYERGVGETPACGTGATACFFAANELDLAGNKGVVRLPGGDLLMEKSEAGEIIMSGTASWNFDGRI